MSKFMLTALQHVTWILLSPRAMKTNVPSTGCTCWYRQVIPNKEFLIGRQVLLLGQLRPGTNSSAAGHLMIGVRWVNLPRCKGHSALKGLAAWTTSSGSRLGSVWYGSKGGGKFLYSCSPQNTWQKAADGWFRISRFWAAWRCEHMFAITTAEACSMHEYHQSSSIPCLLMMLMIKLSWIVKNY